MFVAMTAGAPARPRRPRALGRRHAAALDRVGGSRRRPLTERLRPYTPGRHGRRAPARAAVGRVVPRRRRAALAAASASSSAASSACTRTSRPRLARVHSPLDVTAVPGPPARLGGRRRSGAAGSLSLAVRLPAGGRSAVRRSARRCSAFLVVEQRCRGRRSVAAARPPRAAGRVRAARHAAVGRLLARRRDQPRRQPRLRAAARRTCRVVRSRIQQGLGEIEALQEWADLVRRRRRRPPRPGARAQPRGRRPRAAHLRGGPGHPAGRAARARRARSSAASSRSGSPSPSRPSSPA